jgi:COMPASS component SWD3
MDEISTNLRLFDLKPGASQQDLKFAYKRLVKQWHPDRFAHDPGKAKLAEEKIKEINLAYASLKVYLENPHQPRSTAKAATTVKKRTITAKEFYDRATDLVKEGKYQEATEELGRAIKKNPNYAEAYRYRGFLFSLLGFELRAEKDLKKAEFLGIRITQNSSEFTTNPRSCASNSSAATEATPSRDKVDYFEQCFYKSSTNSSKTQAPVSEQSPHSVREDSKDSNFRVEPDVSAKPESNPPGHKVQDQDYGGHATVQKVEIKLEYSLAHQLNSASVLATSSNCRIIAVGHEDGSISLWNTKTKRQFHSLVGHTGKVTCLKFSDDNQILFSGSEDGTVRLWNLSDGNFIKSLNTHKGSVNGLEICYLRKLLITAGNDGAVRVWDLKKSTLVRQILNHEAPVPSIALNSTGEITICGTHDGSIRFCHTLRGGIVKWLNAHQTPVSALAFSQDGQHFASGAVDGQVMVWDFPKADHKKILQSIRHPVSALAFCQGDQFLCGIDGSGKLLVWEIDSGNLDTFKMAHSSGATTLIPVAENKVLSAGDDSSIHQWQVHRKV